MVEAGIVGFIRKGKEGEYLILAIEEDAFNDSPKYEAHTGARFVKIEVRRDRVEEIIEGERQVAALYSIELE